MLYTMYMGSVRRGIGLPFTIHDSTLAARRRESAAAAELCRPEPSSRSMARSPVPASAQTVSSTATTSVTVGGSNGWRRTGPDMRAPSRRGGGARASEGPSSNAVLMCAAVAGWRATVPRAVGAERCHGVLREASLGPKKNDGARRPSAWGARAMAWTMAVFFGLPAPAAPLSH